MWSCFRIPKKCTGLFLFPLLGMTSSEAEIQMRKFTAKLRFRHPWNHSPCSGSQNGLPSYSIALNYDFFDYRRYFVVSWHACPEPAAYASPKSDRRRVHVTKHFQVGHCASQPVGDSAGHRSMSGQLLKGMRTYAYG
jgi:hypothetical protein